MSIASRITSMSNHIENVYNEIKKFGVDLTSTNKNLENITNVLNDNIYSRLPQVDNSSDSSQLLNAQNGKVDEFKMYGNTEQNSYSGKNLCNGATQNVYLNISANSCGIATDNSGLYIPVNGGNYTISTTETQVRYRVACVNNEPSSTAQTAYKGQNKDNTSDTITIDTTGYSYLIVNATDLTKIQIEQGSTATSWEPFVGGSPSPSPNYPQPIKVVTGTQTINVSGKNLYKPFNFVKTNSNIDFTYSTDGSLKGNGTASPTALSMFSSEATNYLITLPAGTYTISGANNKMNLEVVNSSGTNIASTENTSLGARTFTIDSETQVFIRAKVFNGTVVNNEKIYPQLERSSSVSSYEPYYTPQNYTINLGSLEFCEIGDYRDEIYKNNGNWYKKAYIGKVVLDGSEPDWSYRESGVTGIVTSSHLIDDMLSGNYLDGLANYFHNDKSGKEMNSIRFGVNNSRIYLYYSKDMFTSRDDLIAWLPTHNLIAYYPLATPIDIPITDTTLINQLEALSVFTGTNHFTISNTNNILPYIYVKRLKNLESLS